MPACVTFDRSMPVFSAPPSSKYDPDTPFDSSTNLPFLDAKKIAAAFFSLQNQPQLPQQLLTPPASPRRIALSPFDQVPNEILDEIIGLVHDDNERPVYDVLSTISACSLVSRQFHNVAINWLYRYVPISDPYAFTKFLTEISRHPEKGKLVRTLDFSLYSVVSLGRSANDNKQIKMVVSETLCECLRLVPNLQELLLSEALDPDLDFNVLDIIFGGKVLPKLEAVDFCGCSRGSFVRAFEEMLRSHIEPNSGRVTQNFPPIKRLSLHGCQTLPAHVYPLLLALLPDLTHLDLSSTQINSYGLRSINQHASLQHLYLGNCGNISGRALLSFFLDHPASNVLETLSLRMSEELDHPIRRRDIPLFLSALKAKGTLRSLDICGMAIDDDHVLELPSTLTELGVHRTELTPQGIQTLLAHISNLFYIDIEASLSGGRLRLSHYADVFASIRRKHPNVRVVECSGIGVEATDEILDILYGWHWLHGRSRRGWLVSKAEYEKLGTAGSQGFAKIGWKGNKLNCSLSRKDMHVISILIATF